MGIVKDVRSRFRKIFSTSEKPEQRQEPKQRMPKKEYQGNQEEKKDIAQEVFERTGSIREGVGQSSTRVQRKNAIPQEEPIKKHGIKEKERLFRDKQDAKKTNE